MSAAWGAGLLPSLPGPDLGGALGRRDRAARSACATPRGSPQAAVPEPQGQDPILWAWPRAQVAAELPTLGGTLPRAAMETPAPKPQETGTVGSLSQWVCGVGLRRLTLGEVSLVSQSTSRVRLPASFPCTPFVPAVCSMLMRRREWRWFSFLIGV